MPGPFLWRALQLIQTPNGKHIHPGALLPSRLGLGLSPVVGLIAMAGEETGMPMAGECQQRSAECHLQAPAYFDVSPTQANVVYSQVDLDYCGFLSLLIYLLSLLQFT